MKFPLAYYLMMLYLLMVCRPVLPVISDMLSHSFTEAEHISTVHAKYGSHHREIEIAATANESNGSKKNTHTLANEVSLTEHVVTEECTIGIIWEQTPKYFCPLRPGDLITKYLPVFTPPPEIYG